MRKRTRIEKLEAAEGRGAVSKYLLVTGSVAQTWGTPEERARGYKIQPTNGPSAGAVYLKTWEDVEAFAARPDVDLMVVRVERAERTERPQAAEI